LEEEVTDQTMIEIAAATHVGRVRNINEDSVLATTVTDQEGVAQAAVLLVADGLGGHSDGEVASAMAKNCVDAFIRSSTQAILTKRTNLSTQLASCLTQANKSIYEWGDKLGRALHPGTTMTLCVIAEDRYEIAHVGDSRAYLFSLGGAMQLTDDDSVVAEAVRQGRLSEFDAEASAMRNQLTRSIGTSPNVEPSKYRGILNRGDVVLVCSDGLWECVTAEEMLEYILLGAPLVSLCNELVKRALDRGGNDNITVTAGRVGQWEQKSMRAHLAKRQEITQKNKVGIRRFNPFG
jgi:protein phosphatase